MSSTIPTDFLDTLELAHGAHTKPDDGLCLLEAVAYVAGEKHSDHPKCVSPVLGAFGRNLNDRFGPEDRQRLKPLIPRLIGTAGDGQDEARRALAFDWAVRTGLPRFLDVAGLTDDAAAFRAMPKFTTDAQITAARPALSAVYEKTYEARWSYRAKVRDAVRAELAKLPKPITLDNVVVVVAAVAEAVAVAVAVAEVAAVAVAEAVAVAAAAAEAVAEAEAVAAAAAEAAAVAAADFKLSYSEVYVAVRDALRAKWSQDGSPLGQIAILHATEGIDLFERMIDPSKAA